MGRSPRRISRKKAENLETILPKVNLGIPSDLLTNRPDIKQAELELQASRADVRAARAAFYPSFNINGAIGFQAFEPSFLLMSPQSLAYTILGGLTAPLINRTAIKAEFKSSNARQLEALYNYQKSILNGFIEVSNEMRRINTLEQFLELKSKEVEVMEQSINTSTELFKTGRSTYLEVLITQQNALQSKLELVNAKNRQFNAYVNIYKALGGGWKK